MRNKELNKLGKALSKYCVGSEGNCSVRTADGFIIKASGRSLTDNDFVICDIEGVSKSGRASMEAGFHAFIYKNSDYKVIAHTHPTNVMKIMCGSYDKILLFAFQRMFPDQVVFNGTVSCIVPYATPGEDLIKEMRNVVGAFKEFPKLFLLENHGIVVCANTVKEAIVATQICDKAAEIMAGTTYTKFLSDQQVAAIIKHPDEIYRKELK